ncbi:MAG: zf-HC2 domain-containing protein [Defluviitaleaceae bacterium]|nr:zf-HC2 domain-containing protein [Defluviitaleaceae bacterium]MCL2275432.1 zf-HC2 domain-containing protein [Defluviitaleaceae bacterium]
MISCEIIKDLLPLYVDETLSPESTQLVATHLQTCQTCQREHRQMQGEISARAQETDHEKVTILKTMKTKMFRQKILISVLACSLTVAVGIGINWFAFHNARPMEFSHWTKQVQVSENPLTDETTVRLFSSRDFYGSVGMVRRVNVDGVDTEVIFIHLTETLATRMQRNPNMQRQYINLATIRQGQLLGVGENTPQPQAVEIYYLVAPFRNTVGLTPEEFYALRTEGTFLWRGVIE